MKVEKLKRKIEDVLNSKKEDLYKKLAIVAVITEGFTQIGIGIKPIIVGGQAVEFYTSAGYATKDIDIICDISIMKIDSVLTPLGFKKEGKYWLLEGSNIVIEIKSEPLSGSEEKLTELAIEGLTVYIIGIEDIIIDRLNSYKYWQEYADKEWVMGMIYLNYQEIDWKYLKQRAKEEVTYKELIKFKTLVEK